LSGYLAFSTSPGSALEVSWRPLTTSASSLPFTTQQTIQTVKSTLEQFTMPTNIQETIPSVAICHPHFCNPSS